MKYVYLKKWKRCFLEKWWTKLCNTIGNVFVFGGWYLSFNVKSGWFECTTQCDCECRIKTRTYNLNKFQSILSIKNAITAMTVCKMQRVLNVSKTCLSLIRIVFELDELQNKYETHLSIATKKLLYLFTWFKIAFGWARYFFCYFML